MSRPGATLGAREAMPLDGFLDQTARLNLDALMDKLGGTPGVARELSAARKQVAACAAAMAASDDGRVVLEFLLDATLRRPVFLPGLGPEALVYAAHREGQNAVVWQLLQAIAEGRGETPPNREGV